ncbi:hypothetical protein [Rhodoferax sp.]|uniref:hypothetical protein n=1 Tax=Rhodoferax sp. TaxID=50421 RepID=UPI00374D648B
MLHPIVSDLLWRSLAIFLLIGASVGMALALLLIFKPQLLQRIVRFNPTAAPDHWPVVLR